MPRLTRPITLTAIGLALAFTAASCAQQGVSPASVASAAPATAAAKIDNFRLVTADGFARELYRLKDAPAVVIVMHGAGSSDFAKQAPELEKVRAAYAAKGVEFLALNSNPAD